MKILTQVGSKDRFFEMFQGVNKMKLNEDITNASTENDNLAKNAFDELVNGTLKIQKTNSQSNDNESFIEIVGVDDAGNVVTFNFKVTSSQGDQEGVLSVDSATLIQFKIKSERFDAEIPESDNTIKQLNAERSQEMIDVVSEYVDDNSGAPEAEDSLYEDAVKLIDKIPYKKGTEDMQTNKAYFDQKPTNPEVRVQSDELQKFVNEIQDYEEDSLAMPHDYGDVEIKDIEDDDYTQEPDVEPEDMNQPEEILTPEQKQLILQAYENLVAKNNNAPTMPEITAEANRLEKLNAPPAPPEKIDPENRMAAGKKRVYPKAAEPFLEGNDFSQIAPENILTRGFANLLSPEVKNLIIGKAIEALDNHLGVKKFQMPKENYVKMIKELAMSIYHRGQMDMNEEEEKNDYPDQMGKKFKTKSHYPKKKRKPQTVVKLGESEELKPGENSELTDTPKPVIEPDFDKMGMGIGSDMSGEVNNFDMNFFLK